MVEFVSFPKIGRLKRACVITEKIDGTNAGIQIVGPEHANDPRAVNYVSGADGAFTLFAQSRNRLITPNDDNFGFAAWVRDNACDLIQLGLGAHFGEWWGAGIGRKYGLSSRKFSLFNTARWSNEHPACCDVVPVLYWGDFSTDVVDQMLDELRINGSRAAPGFKNPEGVVVYHSATKTYFKKTLEKDELGKEQ